MFAVSFGMGVVSVIVMPFRFGTNWSGYVGTVLDVVGALMAYEVLTAFFIEAAFLGVLLFGRDRVPRWAHFLSAVMVALGTLLSSFRILSVNRWMHTPAGFEIVDGRWIPTDMMAVVFNPSFPYRLTHTASAFVVATGFVVLAVAARWRLQHRFETESRAMLKSVIAWPDAASATASRSRSRGSRACTRRTTGTARCRASRTGRPRTGRRWRSSAGRSA